MERRVGKVVAKRVRSGGPISWSLGTSASHEAACLGLARTPIFSLLPVFLSQPPRRVRREQRLNHDNNHQNSAEDECDNTSQSHGDASRAASVSASAPAYHHPASIRITVLVTPLRAL